MKALVVLSAVIAVVLCAPSVDKRYVRPGAYVPWQQNRYYNSYNPVRNVYSPQRWYQSTITPVKYEASTLSPWQGKSKFLFGSAIASTPAVAVEPEPEQKVTIVEYAPAVPKVPAGFGAFRFGKKSTPIVITKEEIKPIETITPEIKITKTVVESSNNAEASPISISNKESAQALKNVVVTIPEEIKPVVVDTVSVQSLPEIESSAEALVEYSKQSQLVIAPEVKSQETSKNVDVKETNEKLNKTSHAIEQSNIESAEKSIPEAKPLLVEELKPLSIVENQSASEIKGEVIAPVVIKKKHGFSFSYNPSSNVYNRKALPLYSQAQPSAATVLETKPQPVAIQAIQTIEVKPTLQPEIVESEKATIAPASSTIEILQTTTENIPSTNEYVVPTVDISQPTIQYVSPTVENKPVTLEDEPSTSEYAVSTLDVSQPIIQYQDSSVPSEQYAVYPSTVEDVVATADISQPIIQYASPSEENAPTTVESGQASTESSSATSDYASEISPINSESIDALLSTPEATIEPAQPEIKRETNDYLSTESEAACTEKTTVTIESASNEYLQNDSEPALTTLPSQLVNIESVPAIESSTPLVSEPLTSSVQSESAAVISSQSFSYSSTPSIVKKKHGFSFSYNPSGYVYNKEASFAYKPNSEVAAPEIKVEPVVSTVVPAANIWSNSYNVKKNSFSFPYNPSFSYFNKQPYYQPQVAVTEPSATPVVSGPAVIQSSSSNIEFAPLTIESTPAASEYVESSTTFFENSSEDAQSITTESSLSETTTLNIEYGSTEPEEKASVVLELAHTTAKSNVNLGTQSAVVESLNVAAESPSSTDNGATTPDCISSSIAVPSVAPQVLPAGNTWSNTYNTKKNAFSFSSLPSFSYFNKPAYQPQIAVIVPASASIPSVSYNSPIATTSNVAQVEPLPSLHESNVAAIESSSSSIKISPISAESAPLVPEIAESTTTLNEIATDNAELESFTTESYSDETTTLAIDTNESFSTTQISSATVELVPVIIESSIKEALNGQLAIASISKETAPVVIEIIPAAAKSENKSQSSSVIGCSSVSVESASASSLSETFNIEYGTTEPEEKASVVLELAPTTAKSNVNLGIQSSVVESLNVAAESPSSTDKGAATPDFISSSFAVPPVAPKVLPAGNTWSNTYNRKKNVFSFSSLPSFSYFNKPAYQPQIPLIVPASASIPSVSYNSPIATTSNVAQVEPLPSLPESSVAAIESSSSPIEISHISAESAPLVPEIAETTTALNEIATDNAEFESFTTESYKDETTTLAIDTNESFPTTQISSATVESVPAVIEYSIKDVLNGQLAIASNSKETAPAPVAPVVIEITPTAVKSENITHSPSVISSSSVSLGCATASAVSSPVLIESAPAVVTSVHAIPVPLYVKELTKVSPPVALPDFQPPSATKKQGFSLSYKPSGNYYKKPKVIVSAAPAIVESSPVLASVSPAIVESSPVIASVAPAIVESSPVIASVSPAIVESSTVIASVVPALVESSQEVTTRPSIFLSLFNAVKSAILEEETTEKSAEAKHEISLSPSAAAESQILNEAEVSSQYDIAFKASPISPELTEEGKLIHDLRLGD